MSELAEPFDMALPSFLHHLRVLEASELVDSVKNGRVRRYVARAIHGTAADRKKHEEMGFHEGWGKTLDQLVAVARGL